MPSNIDADTNADNVAPALPATGGLTDPATWVAIYVLAALLLLVLIRRGFRPAIPG